MWCGFSCSRCCIWCKKPLTAYRRSFPMSDPHADLAPADHAHDDHAGHISDKTFLKVFIGLMIFTAATFATNQILGARAAVLSFIIIGGIAICKALLVIAF